MCANIAADIQQPCQSLLPLPQSTRHMVGVKARIWDYGVLGRLAVHTWGLDFTISSGAPNFSPQGTAAVQMGARVACGASLS